jgi:hypothetical protein
MESIKKMWPVFISLFVVLVCVVLFAVMARWNGLKLNLDPRNVAGLLGPITLAAAFIERAVEVVISPWRDREADSLVHQLDKADKHLAVTTLTATTANTVAAAAIADPALQAAATTAAQQSSQAATTAVANASTAAIAMTDYRGLTKQYAYAVSLLLGILIAYSGVRGLENLCVVNALSTVSWGQKLMFEVVDVILSGAVMAGGANGIHSIVNLVTSFADTTSEKVKQSANG